MFSFLSAKMHTAGGEIVLIVFCSFLIGMGLYTASLCIATIWLISAIDFSDIASSMKVVAEKFLLTCIPVLLVALESMGWFHFNF